MEALDLIRLKRSGRALDSQQINWLVKGIVDASIPDYQLSALLMAITYEGLNEEETGDLTLALAASGETLDWSFLPGKVVDKHSTGGVGDKVSVALIPWLAAAGLYVPKLSGRGLGHTGGTVDKLESIPGFRCELSHAEQVELVSRLGCMDAAQSPGIVPADKKLYALRDATDTVREDGLVASSVMSKKLASGAHFLVLDVKCGNGAFFADEARAYRFARLALGIGRRAGREVACVISDMNQPLGHCIGNALEVQEAFEMLRSGEGPQDLRELCETIGGALLVLTGDCQRLTQGRARMLELLSSGAAWSKAQAWVEAQGGDLAAFAESLEAIRGYRRVRLEAVAAGFVRGFDTVGLGELARRLGAGRTHLKDPILPLVGLRIEKKIGDQFAAGELLAEAIVSPDDPQSDAEILEQLSNSVRCGTEDVQPPLLIKDVLF